MSSQVLQIMILSCEKCFYSKHGANPSPALLSGATPGLEEAASWEDQKRGLSLHRVSGRTHSLDCEVTTDHLIEKGHGGWNHATRAAQS